MEHKNILRHSTNPGVNYKKTEKTVQQTLKTNSKQRKRNQTTILTIVGLHIRMSWTKQFNETRRKYRWNRGSALESEQQNTKIKELKGFLAGSHMPHPILDCWRSDRLPTNRLLRRQQYSKPYYIYKKNVASKKRKIWRRRGMAFVQRLESTVANGQYVHQDEAHGCHSLRT